MYISYAKPYETNFIPNIKYLEGNISFSHHMLPYLLRFTPKLYKTKITFSVLL